MMVNNDFLSQALGRPEHRNVPSNFATTHFRHPLFRSHVRSVYSEHFPRAPFLTHRLC